MGTTMQAQLFYPTIPNRYNRIMNMSIFGKSAKILKKKKFLFPTQLYGNTEVGKVSHTV